MAPRMTLSKYEIRNIFPLFMSLSNMIISLGFRTVAQWISILFSTHKCIKAFKVGPLGRTDHLLDEVTVWPFNKVKTTEKVLLGLHKWRQRSLNRGRNYSASRDAIFGTLKADRLIEGDRLIRCRLIQVRLYFYASFNHRNRSGPFLSAYFLFWEIFNLSLTFSRLR